MPKEDLTGRKQDFVGRSKDFRQLTDALAEAEKNRPVTVLLGGEPGVGKTRLLRELTMAAKQQNAHVFFGGCIELGGGPVPYAPLIEALRILVRDFGEEEVREIAGDTWPDLAALISDFIAPGSTGSGSTGSGSKGSEPTGSRPVGARSQLHVFGAVMRLLEHLGKSAPVVLVFEDLHWADPSTLDLVAYLTRSKSTERMMLIGSYRSKLPQEHPLRKLLAEPDFAKRIQRMEISAFTEAELRRFLSKSGSINGDLVRRCFDLSGGNAFFAEQLVSSGVLNDPELTKVPDLLAEVMRTRIGSLGNDATRLIQVAATASRKVSERLLSTVGELTDRQLDDALEECVREGILAVDPVDEDAFVFQHALLRETVYTDLLPGARKRLHSAMAEAITGSPALGFAEDLTATTELAYHWLHAGRKPEAFVAAIKAGAATSRVRTFHEAETHYTQALTLWPEVLHPETLAKMSREQVLAAAADAASWAGHVGVAVEFVGKAIAAVDPVADPHRAGELHERLGNYQWAAGKPVESSAAYARAADLLANQPPDALMARVMAARAMEEVRGGQFAIGFRQATAALSLAKEVGSAAARCHALSAAGMALTFLGQPEQGESMLREALGIAQEAKQMEDIFRLQANLGVAFEHVGNLSEAAEVALEGLREARRLGLMSSRQAGVMANNAAFALFSMGRWEEAVELLDEALSNRSSVQESAYLRLTLAEIHVAGGRFDEARKLLGDLRAGSLADPRFHGPVYICDAEIALWRGDPVAAQLAVEKGIAAVGGSENMLVLLQLRAAGLRAIADARQVSAGQADLADVVADGPGGDILTGLTVAVADGRRAASLQETLLGQLCEAEQARADGVDTQAIWAQIAGAWDESGQPYRSAYARWREAGAAKTAGNLPHASEAADVARDLAERLGAQPLLTAIENLFPAVSTPTEKPARNSYALTKRELETLALINAGRSNSEIAAHLFITPSTVSVHVTNILKKLDVPSRGAAAAKARNEGLLPPA